MKLKETFDPEVLERAKTFGLDPHMVSLLWMGDPVKLTYMWVKQGHVDYRTFQKLMRYISES